MPQTNGSPDPTTHPAPEPGYDDDPDLAPDPLHEPEPGREWPEPGDEPPATSST